MKDVILKGGGKTIIDVDKCIFFYMESKKDLEYLNSNKKFGKIKFPSIYIKLGSSISDEKMELIYPLDKNFIRIDKMLEDYKKDKISNEMHEEILDLLMKTYITSQLKNGIFRKSDIKINLLKKTKLIFVNAIAYTDKDKKKYFSRFEKK